MAERKDKKDAMGGEEREPERSDAHRWRHGHGSTSPKRALEPAAQTAGSPKDAQGRAPVRPLPRAGGWRCTAWS